MPTELERDELCFVTPSMFVSCFGAGVGEAGACAAYFVNVCPFPKQHCSSLRSSAFLYMSVFRARHTVTTITIITRRNYLPTGGFGPSPTRSRWRCWNSKSCPKAGADSMGFSRCLCAGAVGHIGHHWTTLTWRKSCVTPCRQSKAGPRFLRGALRSAPVQALGGVQEAERKAQNSGIPQDSQGCTLRPL